MKRLIASVSLAVLITAALAAQNLLPPRRQGQAAPDMNAISERYVKLVLALGRHDADYVDAYYGPPEWKREAESTQVPLDELAARARALLEALAAIPAPAGEVEQLRLRYLERQLSSLAARIRILKGERLSFDE